MIEFAFVWVGIGALAFLLMTSGLGGRVTNDITGDECVSMLLIFFLFWPFISYEMYKDRKSFRF